MTLKTITLLKRRSDLTMEDFIHRYETGHAKLGERVLEGYATRYVRRFLLPLGEPAQDCEVVMEIWYAVRERFDAFIAYATQPAVYAEIAADEETLFDRSKTRVFFVEEHESPIGA
ncbi:MAG: hypothetical protein JWM33_3676 [Caulobacteraceae bacterium]|nr:hypothetical protein [Caulobacteraceae bacterium]